MFIHNSNSINSFAPDERKKERKKRDPLPSKAVNCSPELENIKKRSGLELLILSRSALDFSSSSPIHIEALVFFLLALYSPLLPRSALFAYQILIFHLLSIKWRMFSFLLLACGERSEFAIVLHFKHLPFSKKKNNKMLFKHCAEFVNTRMEKIQRHD